MARNTHLLWLTVASLCAALTAQDAEQKLAPKTARLGRACATMAGVDSVRFSCEELHEANTPGGRANKTRRKTEGSVSGELLAATGDGGHERIVRGRIAIAREENDPWCVRDHRWADGTDVGFLLDPTALFQQLAALRPAAVHADVSTHDERPVELITATIEGDDAVDLLWGGVLPQPSVGNTFILMGGAPGKAPTPPKPDVRIDLAFAIDPATERVLGVRVRIDSDNPGGAVFGGGVIAVRAIGGVRLPEQQAEEEEPEKEATSGEPRYDDGLPVRKLEQNRARVTLTIGFRDHGTVEPPALDERARRLLGLPEQKR